SPSAHSGQDLARRTPAPESTPRLLPLGQSRPGVVGAGHRLNCMSTGPAAEAPGLERTAAAKAPLVYWVQFLVAAGLAVLMPAGRTHRSAAPVAPEPGSQTTP